VDVNGPRLRRGPSAARPGAHTPGERKSRAASLRMTDNRHAMVYHTYILASASGVLYIGVTNHLERRGLQHKLGETRGFTKKYEVHRLVYFEEFGDVRNAIVREKQLKGWKREKKLELIRRVNPRMRDLSEDFLK